MCFRSLNSRFKRSRNFLSNWYWFLWQEWYTNHKLVKSLIVLILFFIYSKELAISLLLYHTAYNRKSFVLYISVKLYPSFRYQSISSFLKPHRLLCFLLARKHKIVDITQIINICFTISDVSCHYCSQGFLHTK